MKTITIDDELYAFIAAQTKYIGEDASDILRRLLLPEDAAQTQPVASASQKVEVAEASATIVASSADAAVSAAPMTATFTPDSKALAQCNTVVERFLLLLGELHTHHKADYSRVLAIKGKGRDYFAITKEQLLATGSSTNPKAIPGSDYWVVTNNNTGKKAAILRQVAEVLGYSPSQQDAIIAGLTQA
ncbi:hypothetical protein [Alteromonas flava]|uniref:hypothetical protein n=1 Tax=Alteromonas flava TaxID=2048003 RepID=UPI000C288CF2|nr:hypothetical protein [Alteromonas flava]